MDIQKKYSLTENEIQQIKDLAYICGQQESLDYSSDLHINFLTNRNEDQINDFLLYKGTQLIGALNIYDFERPTKLELIGFVHPHFRKQQIGTNLLQTAMKEILSYMVYILLAKGISTIELEVETKNSNALNLYTQCGFEITKTHDYYNLLHKK
ncbi:TPA: GNAT family N-acetyltransferase [Bacillus luti]|nr:GNAT family N-acetyltransferase [Bacillus luti]